MKKDIFNEVMRNVCKAMELDVDSVKTSHKEECVDARYVVIAVLSERYSDRQIAEISGWSWAMVNKARNAFKDRCKFRWGLKDAYKQILQTLSKLSPNC